MYVLKMGQFCAFCSAIRNVLILKVMTVLYFKPNLYFNLSCFPGNASTQTDSIVFNIEGLYDLFQINRLIILNVPIVKVLFLI